MEKPHYAKESATPYLNMSVPQSQDAIAKPYYVNGHISKVWILHTAQLLTGVGLHELCAGVTTG